MTDESEDFNKEMFRIMYPESGMPEIYPRFMDSWPAASIIMNHLLSMDTIRSVQIVMNDFGAWECDIQYIDEIWGLTYNHSDDSARRSFVMCAYMLLQDLERRNKS